MPAKPADYPNGLLDYVNQRRNYAATDFNQTHIFNESFLWHLPIWAGSRLVSSGVPGQMLGGWELTGIWEGPGGFPLTFTCTCIVIQHSGQYGLSQHQRPVPQAAWHSNNALV